MSANHISTVRQHLIDQLAALRTASGSDAVRLEIDRAKGISDVAQVIVNSAKVEVEYLQKTNQTSTPFLEASPDAPYITTQTDGLPSGISSITRHRIGG
jgi:hypothetical protein